MHGSRNVTRRLVSTVLALVLLVLTTNAYACVIPLYGWGSPAMEACNVPQEPARDYCEPFKSLGFHAAPPKLPPLVLHHQPVLVFELTAWSSGPAAIAGPAIAPIDVHPPDLLTLISVLRI